MKHNKNKSEAPIFRIRAEELLKKSLSGLSSRLNEADTMNLLNGIESLMAELSFDLNERVKELNCHNRISEVLSNSSLSVDEVCEQVVQLIPDGWQFPDITGAFIQIREKSFQTKQFTENGNFLLQDIKTDGRVIGCVKVSLPNDNLPAARQTFLPEESDLLFTIAVRLGNFIGKQMSDNVLTESEEKYSRAFQTSPYAIIISRASDGMIVDINDAFSLISGYSREEAINDLTVRLNLWADPEDRKRVIGSLMEGNKITGEEYQFRRKSGEVMYGVFSAQITHINNEHYILSSINDITDRKVAEEKLRQREAALNYSQEIAKMWSWELNPHTSKVSWSMNYYLLLGQKPDDNELSYESFEKMVHPDDKHLLDETLSGIYQTRNPANVDLRLMMPDGQVKWIQNNVVPTFDGDTLIDLKGVSIDITEKKLNENEICNLNASLELKIKAGTLKLSETNENLQKEIENRKRVEADLEESLEKYRGLSEASFEAIFISETGVCIEQNLAAEKMFGYTSEEALTRYGTDWIVPEERKMVMNNMLAGNENPFEATALRKDGTTFPCVLHGGMMHYKGKNVRVTSLTDITERKKAEIALHNSQEQLELVIKGSNDAPWDWNLVENNLFYSSKWWQQIGYAPEEIPSDSTLWRNLTHPDDIDRINLIFETALKSGNDSYDAEFRLLHKNGYYVPVLSRGFITRDANRKPIRVTGTNMDLTERYHAEKEIIKSRDEAQKANLAKSEFLSRMSHELRTPLNSVLGFAQLMAMGELNPKQKKSVNHILTNGKHLLGLINEVLDISHIESGRLSLMFESVQLSQIISETLDTVQPFADARQITMSLDNSPHNQLFVISDRKRLKQALINLLTNAVKYNRHGGTISVKSEPGPPIEEGRVSVRISVTDTGLGIHPDDIPKLFTPFERIGAEKTQTEGTGLGLAVVKKIMDAMKGTVGVETVVDKGSTFWLELPGAEEHMGQDRQKEDHESRITGQDVAGKRQSRLLF